MPQIEVRRTNGDLMVKAELPGLNKVDVKVELTDEALNISGERKEEVLSMHVLTDSETEQWVLRELSLRDKIRSHEICVLACDGVVRLQGSAPNDSDRSAVEEATRNAPGVVSVVNEMTVKIPTGLVAERSATVLVVPRSTHLEAQLQS